MTAVVFADREDAAVYFELVFSAYYIVARRKRGGEN